MRLSIKFVARTALLLALTLVMQLGGFPQPITGPAVNMMLLLSASFAGPLAAVIIGALTPIVAFVRGIMGFPPIIPYIIIGNALYVLGFYYTGNILTRLVKMDSKIESIMDIIFGAGGVLVGAVLKFLVLSSAVKFFIQAPPKVAQMMQVPQLVTALSGGAIALVVTAWILKSGALKKAK